MLRGRCFRKRQGEGQHVVRRLPPIRLVAPLRREIADGLFPKDQGSVFPLQRQLALVALIIHQRAGADASRAIARQFHHGGLRPGGETRLHRAGRTQTAAPPPGDDDAARFSGRAGAALAPAAALPEPPLAFPGREKFHSSSARLDRSAGAGAAWSDERKWSAGRIRSRRRGRRIGVRARRIPIILRGSGGEQRVLFVLVARQSPSPHGDKATPHVQGVKGAHVAPAQTASLAR